MKTVLMSLMTILQSLNMKRSVMMFLSLNNDEKNVIIKNNDTFTVI